MKKRLETLLTQTARDLKDGRSPLNSDFLLEHNVTLDECFDLANIMACIIAGYVESPQRDRFKLDARGAAVLAGVDAVAVEMALCSSEMDRLTKVLGATPLPSGAQHD